MLAYASPGARYSPTMGPFTMSTDGSDLSLPGDSVAGSGGADAVPSNGTVLNSDQRSIMNAYFGAGQNTGTWNVAIDASGHLLVYGNPALDANGNPMTLDGKSEVDMPIDTVRPSAADIAIAENGNDAMGIETTTVLDQREANQLLRSKLGMDSNGEFPANQIVNIFPPTGPSMSDNSSGVNLRPEELQRRASLAFSGGGKPLFTIKVSDRWIVGYAEKSGTAASRESVEISTDAQDYAETHSPGNTAPTNEGPKSAVDAIEMAQGALSNARDASNAALRYTYDVYQSSSDPNDVRVEVTAYMINADGNVVSYKPYLQKANEILNNN
jgi:hypothetical protein